MKFFIALFALVAVASAKQGNYVFKGNHGYHQQSFNLGGGSSGGGRGSYGAVAGGSRSAGLQNVQLVALVSAGQQQGYSQGYSQASSAQSSGPIYAAVQSTRNVQFVEGPSAQPAQAQTIIIGPSVQPLDFEFQSQSSPITVRQSHIPGQASEPQSSSHTEEPDLLRQEIVKPIIHEVTEAIQPYRKVTQEVRPVEETINQILTRGQQQQQVQSASRAQSVGVVQAIPVRAVQVQAQPQVQTITLQPVQSQSVGQSLGTFQIVGGLEGLTGFGSSVGGSSFGGLSGGNYQIRRK